MIKILFYIVISITGFSIFYIKSNEVSINEATTLVNTFIENIKNANTNNLEEILDSNYQHIHGSGIIENKQQFIILLKNKAKIYNKADVSNIKITLLGKNAYISGKIKIKVSTPKVTIDGENFFTIIISKNNNKLSILQFQATKLL